MVRKMIPLCPYIKHVNPSTNSLCKPVPKPVVRICACICARVCAWIAHRFVHGLAHRFVCFYCGQICGRVCAWVCPCLLMGLHSWVIILNISQASCELKRNQNSIWMKSWNLSHLRASFLFSGHFFKLFFFRATLQKSPRNDRNLQVRHRNQHIKSKIFEWRCKQRRAFRQND